MNILVTGSNGLIGYQLIKFLVQKKINVVGFDLNIPNDYSFQYRFKHGSVEDFAHLASVVKTHKIDVIIHAGGISHPKIAENSPNRIIQTNIIGTTNLFEIARLFAVKKVVYLSSGAVYGDNKKSLLNESERLTPTSIYGVSKVTGEYLAQVFTQKYDTSITSLRIPFVYGPGRKMHDPIKFLLEKAQKGENVNEENGMDQKLEYIYVKDVVHAIWLAINFKDTNGEVFNIGPGKFTSMTEIIAVVKELYPEVSIKLGPGDFGYDEMGLLDCGKAEKILKFNPQYSLREGMYEYAKFLDE